MLVALIEILKTTLTLTSAKQNIVQYFFLAKFGGLSVD